MKFRLSKEFPASKSLLNRALVVQSFSTTFKIAGESKAGDVQDLRRALEQFKSGESASAEHYSIAEGGTSFRFLAFRLSREPGHHVIRVGERLRSRPQNEMVDLLRQLGVQSEWQNFDFHISGRGWQFSGTPLVSSLERSSQFISGLVLSAWHLPQKLQIRIPKNQMKSESYWRMTQNLCRRLGMQLEVKETETDVWLAIPASQEVVGRTWTCEPDVSSIFSMAAMASLAGDLTVTNFPLNSLQPDIVFLEIFNKLGVQYELAEQRFSLRAQKIRKDLDWDLRNSPDLFPVLAAWASCMGVNAKLTGADHLIHKESDRIASTQSLLTLLQVPYRELQGGLEVLGRAWHRPVFFAPLSFDPQKDHRLAFAAACFAITGTSLRLTEPGVINKSFPEFYEWSQWNPEAGI